MRHWQDPRRVGWIAVRFIARVDDWWDRTAPTRRLDRNGANMALLIGLVLSTFSIILIGPAPSSSLRHMSLGLQLGMSCCIFFGCLTKLHGALSHSRFWFPNTKIKTCYQIGFGGAPLASSGLFVYGWYLVENTPSWTSALSAVLTPLLGIGILVQSVFYLLEARRIGRNERLIIEQTKQVIREQRLAD